MAKEAEIRNVPNPTHTQETVVRIIEKPVVDEKSLIAHFLVSVETLRLSKPISYRPLIQ